MVRRLTVSLALLDSALTPTNLPSRPGSRVRALNAVVTVTPWLGPVCDADLIARRHVSRAEHLQVCPAASALGEAFDPAWFVQETSEGAAGNPRVTNLQYQRLADCPVLADYRLTDIDTGGGEIFAE